MGANLKNSPRGTQILARIDAHCTLSCTSRLHGETKGERGLLGARERLFIFQIAMIVVCGLPIWGGGHILHWVRGLTVTAQILPKEENH